MAKKIANDKNTDSVKKAKASTEQAFENSIIDADYDFMSDVITEYGEINNKYELNLIVKKIKNEAQRENAKINKKKKIVAQRNKALIKNNKKKARLKKSAFASLPPQKKMMYRQKMAEEAIKQKELDVANKIALTEQKTQQAVMLKEKKAQDAEYRMYEKLAILAMDPVEKSEYLFQRNAKKKIEAAKALKISALDKQKEVAQSNILPIGGFLRFLFISMIVAAVLAYCGTNIYLDMGYYTEKIDELKAGIADYDIKLDGDMVVGVGDLESGLSVYNQILGNAPVMEEQLEKLNKSYFWIYNKETPENLGIDAIKTEAEELKKVIDSIQLIVDSNAKYSTDLIDTYNSDLSLLELKESLLPFEARIDKISSDLDTVTLPKGLGEHKEAFSKKISVNKDYYKIMIAYLDELIVIRGSLSDANEVVASAQSIRPHSGTLGEMVDDYVSKLSDVVATERKITAANNNTEFASIIGKKDLGYVGKDIMSDESISFYENIMELKTIASQSNKVQRKCLDLPYPQVKKTRDEVIQSYISQNTTETALEENAKLVERISSVIAPDRLESKVRKYKTGLEIRTEFLEQQKIYIDLEETKNDVFVDYDNAEADYTTYYNLARYERKKNGRGDKYYEYYNLSLEAEAAMEAAEIAAQDDANTIQESMKPVRVKAMDLKDDYEDYMDY
jgi:hypothetical protein